MSVAAVHLNHYLTENPVQSAAKLKCKARIFNILEKICWVALAAIVAAVLTISYSSKVLTGTASLFVAGMALSTILFACGLSYFSTRSSQLSREAEHENGVARHLKDLKETKKWKTPEIQRFLEEQGVDLHQIPLESLRRLNREEPLCALLPLIARFNYLKECAQNLEGIAQEEAKKQYADIDDLDKRRKFQSTSRRIACEIHELKAIPKMLEAAILLPILQQPTQELSLLSIGKFAEKSLEERVLDRDPRYGPTNDDYFIRHDGCIITLTEIEQNMEPRALRLKLLPNRV